MNEFTAQFLAEGRELTDQAAKDLLVLEERPGDGELLENVFRTFHTLKGAAGIMEYLAMEQLLHRAEDVLQQVRSGERGVEPALIDALLATVGQVVRWCDQIEASGGMPVAASREAQETLRLFDRRDPVARATRTDPANASADRDAMLAAARAAGHDISRARTALRYTPSRNAFFEGKDPVASVQALPDLLWFSMSADRPWPPAAEISAFEANITIEALFASPRDKLEGRFEDPSGEVSWADIETDAGASPVAVARAILEEQVLFLRTAADAAAVAARMAAAERVAQNVALAAGFATAGLEAAIALRDRKALIAALEAILQGKSSQLAQGRSEVSATRDTASNTIRVDVDRIDHIVSLAGEILVVKNALGHWARVAAEGGDPQALAAGLRTQHDELARHLSELQASAFQLRVLPMERVFSRFPRLVRETASSLGKQVRLLTEGADTRADKAIVEALFEPLLHLIRNALDHGVESSAERVTGGKPAEATLVLRAMRDGDSVVVELDDDGRGLDPGAIRRLAIARGAVEEAAAIQMSDAQATELIFAPGFSTARSVTDLSGRGVGMGAVRAAIARVGGEVALLNDQGRGLTVRLVLPFTIALTRIMTLQAGGQTFGLPFDAVIETVRIPRDQIRPLGHGRVAVIRGRTLPVVNVASVLDLPASPASDTVCLLVTWVSGQEIALEIDRPMERLEMMMKPASGILAGLPSIAGTSLTGDGSVLVILDPKAFLA